MRFAHQVITGLNDATQNFEQIELQRLYSGNGAPAFRPREQSAYYFRFDTPGTSMQRIYIFNGTAWVGIV